MKAIILDFYGVIYDPTTRQPMVGVVEFLNEVKRRNISCAIASSTDSRSIQQFLEEHHLSEYISTVIGAEKVSAIKPDPECYVLAAGELGVVPKDALVIDDTLVPLENAKALGFQTIYFHHDLVNFSAIAKLIQIQQCVRAHWRCFDARDSTVLDDRRVGSC